MTVRTALFTCVVLAASFSAQAQDAGTATDNHCWGDISSDFAQLGLMGEHSRRNSTMRPEDQPRDGVGNVSKDGDGDAERRRPRRSRCGSRRPDPRGVWWSPHLRLSPDRLIAPVKHHMVFNRQI